MERNIKIKANPGVKKIQLSLPKSMIRNQNKNKKSQKYKPGTVEPIAKQMVQYKQVTNLKHLQDLLDPWNAKEARLPSPYEIYSKTAKVKSSFIVSTNALGCLLMAIDPDYLTAAGVTTTYVYNTNALLNGTTITPTTWTGTALGAQPVPPTLIFSKYRLVSASVIATIKLPALTIVGNAFSCIAYDNVAPTGTGNTLVPQIGLDQYQNFQNIENGPGGCKIDITAAITKLSLNWLPVDPLSMVFLAPNGEIDDQNAVEAGAYQKLILGFSGLPATTNILFDVVLNWEMMNLGSSNAWLGGSSQNAPTLAQHEEVLNFAKANVGRPLDQLFTMIKGGPAGTNSELQRLSKQYDNSLIFPKPR